MLPVRIKKNVARAMQNLSLLLHLQWAQDLFKHRAEYFWAKNVIESYKKCTEWNILVITALGTWEGQL